MNFMKYVIILLIFAGQILFTGCSSEAKPEPDENQSPTKVEAPNEDVTMEQTHSSQDYTVDENEPQQNLYHAVLGPFFKVSAYIPYNVKVECEEQIEKVRENLEDDRHLKIKVNAFYPPEDSHEKILAAERAKNIIDYAVWKSKLSRDSFVSDLIPTSDTTKFYTIEFDLNVPAGTKLVKKTRTVYYTGEKAVKKPKEEESNVAEASSDKKDSSADENINAPSSSDQNSEKK